LHPDRQYWYRALITTADGKATSQIGTFRTTASVAVKPALKLKKFTPYDADRTVVSYIAYDPGVSMMFTARWSLRPDMSASTVYYTDTVRPVVGAVSFHPIFKLSSVPAFTQLWFTAQITSPNGTATTPGQRLLRRTEALIAALRSVA
jgi:hypothetical protein